MMNFDSHIISNEDAELIGRCKKNDRLAYKAIFDKYSSLFMAISFRYMKDKEKAEDIIQDAFIRIFNNLDKYNYQGSFEGWMKKTVVRTALNAIRKETNRKEDEFNPDYSFHGLKARNDGMENLLEGDLLEILEQLPKGYRTVFQLYAIEGFNHKEIGEMLDISEGTSKSQLSKARQILKSIVDPVNHGSYGK